ncbi:phosphofurin acidic cluster sorting protein 2 isoform X3 [Bactrocera neohumeralis]|uniref:phosphofurin acidic cluster sorting protein 2 isoform X3 n=1 Tax=Bactrocera neohumeralis TaxID=98809 RepID=UPI0021667B1B|nr:phosphofurin acidic cluster sorting protein 2 isoform X3 [Bactrocera neohumeralis]
MKMVDKSSKLDKFSANMGVSGTGAGGSGGGGSGVNSGFTTGASCLLHTGVGSQNGQKPVPMKLFAAWEVDRTPPNCMPRLCSLTITRLSILTPLPGDMTSLTLAVKMQSSKRTLRSHEIPINSSGFTQSGASGGAVTGSTAPNSGGGAAGNIIQQSNSGAALIGGSSGSAQMGSAIIGTPGNIGNTGIGIGGSGSGASMTMGGFAAVGGGATTMPLAETELDLHFSLQYPHFIKRDGNSNRIGYNLPFSPFSRSNAHRLVILLQRRKKYKSRTILGYKTLAEGIIRMDAVLQKSMDMTVELTASGKNGRPGTTVACLRAERVSSIPVDQDNKNNNSVLLADRVAEYSDEDEEGEFSSGEFNDDAAELGIPGYDPKRDYNPSKHDMRKYRKLQRSEVEDVALGTNPVDSDSEFEMKDKSSSRAKISRTISLQQRNFKQKIVALLKRFKASEELEGEVSRGTAALRGERDLDALFQELESLSCCEGDDSGPDMDSLSIGSTPKPSLRPFFTNSRIMLHDNSAGGDRPTDYRNDSSGNEGNAFNTDGQNSDPQNSPPRSDKDYMRLQLLQQQQQQLTPVSGGGNSGSAFTFSEKRSRLFRTSSNTPSGAGSGSGGGGAIGMGMGKKKQTLSLTAEPRSVLETCLSPTNVEPRKLLLDQLSRIFASEDTNLPDVVTIISPPEALSGSALIPKLTTLLANSFKPAFVPQNTAEVKAVLQALMGKIQKYCNSNAKPPNTVKILLLGGDWLQGAALRHYVELMGVRPPDWLNHLRFYIVPIGSGSTIARYLSQVDLTYGAMFGSDNWYQLCERVAATAAAVSAVTTVNASALSTTLGDSVTANKSDIVEMVQRIQRYLHAAGPCTQIPIGEAMVNYKDEDSRQIFVPFVSDVRIGYLEGPQVSLDLEENATQAGGNTGAQQSLHMSSAIPIGSSNATNLTGAGGVAGGNNAPSGSPPQSGRISPPQQTPPTSANALRDRGGDSINTPTAQSNAASESVELQVDYWPIIRPGDYTPKEKSITRGGDQGGKSSIKSTFRNLQVWRLPQNAQLGEMSHGMTVNFATKEKKQKQIMRLGKKKEKDRDLEKEQCVEGVARLICSPKPSHPVPLRVFIDGTEWTGVKFFQLSSQWQTHVKNFPIALIGCTPMSCSEIS